MLILLLLVLFSWQSDSFKVADSDNDGNSLSFLMIGDWGHVSTELTSTASAMGLLADQANPEFVIALGDNFYDVGVTNDTDPLW